MRHTLSFPEPRFAALLQEIFSLPDVEGAAYLLCSRSQTTDELRLLAREVIPVVPEDYLVREPLRLSIDSRSYARVAKRAVETGASVLFVHSHPGGEAEFSPQDNREEPALMRFLQARAPTGIHGSLVISSADAVCGRVWSVDGWRPIERVRVPGGRFRFLDRARATPLDVFDRQVRAFGPDLQPLLASLHIGVVGAGGTGSPLAEQLVRLGVGTLSLFDGDVLEATNVTRVYGSTLKDVRRPKAEVLGEHLRGIGLGTDLRIFSRYISDEATARELRACDIVFGCTDKEAPRALLVQLCLRYVIPVIDMGVTISSAGGRIRDVTGRVTTLLPGEACLFCRERISPERIRLEQLPEAERRGLVAEGYAPELGTRDPAVVMFTTAVAAQAVTELVHRLTSFLGDERRSTEVLQRFLSTETRKNRQGPAAGCLCTQEVLWGSGDGPDFLGVMWG